MSIHKCKTCSCESEKMCKDYNCYCKKCGCNILLGTCQFFNERLFWQCPRKEVELYLCEKCNTYVCLIHYDPLTKNCNLCLKKVK